MVSRLPPSSRESIEEDRTARNAGRKYSARHLHAHATTQTFFDDNPRSSDFSVPQSPRHAPAHSHELSIRDVTRDSMVDNLVQSLNFMPEDVEDYTLAATPVQPQFTPRAIPQSYRAMQSETSSEYDLRVEEYFTTNDGNSSPSLPNRNDSTGRPRTPRASAEQPESRQKHRSSPDTARTRTEGKKAHKHSKSSSTSSAGGTPSRNRNKSSNTPSRAEQTAAPDSTPTQPSSRDLRPKNGQSILDRARPLPSEYHDFDDSAPMPSIPLHRREAPSPSYSGRFLGPDGFPMSPSSTPSPRQANYKQQYSSRNKIATLAGSDAMLPEDRKAYHQSSYADQTHKKKGSDEQSLRSKMKPQIIRTNQSLDTLPKEKTGFFKRVFGSSKSNNPTADVPPQIPPLPAVIPSEPVAASLSENGSARQGSQTTALPPMPPEPVGGDREPPQVLHKKTSFFRRRKKTVSEKDQPSTEPSMPTTTTSTNLNSPSVSSLQKVMQPFFSEDVTPQLGSPQPEFFDSREEQPRSRKSSLSSRIRPSTGLRVNDGRKGSIPYSASSTSSRYEAPRPSTSLRNEKVSTPNTNRYPTPVFNDSFLNDSSGTEGRSPRIDTRSSEQRRPHTSRDFSTKNELPFRQTEMPERKPKPDRQEPVSPTSPASPRKRAPIPLAMGQAKATEAQTDDGWVMPTPTKRETESRGSNKSNRIWLKPTASEEKISEAANPIIPSAPPDETIRLVSRESGDSALVDSTKEVPIVQVDGEDDEQPREIVAEDPMDPNEPNEIEYERAKQLFDGQDDPIGRVQAMSILGELGTLGERMRRAYMSFFDFAGLNTLLAFRDLCARLTLKAETQQVDRVISSFSRRWCECNPYHGFKSQDVIHLICYSLLLLNTDLHVADLDQKMTRNQFVKNTLSTIQRMVEEENGQNDSTIRPNRATARPPIPFRDARSPSPINAEEFRPSLELRNDSRLSARGSQRPISEVPSFASPSPYDTRSSETSDLLLHSPFEGSMKAWETQVEMVLREFYTSIRNQRIPLHGASEMRLHEQHSNNSLGVSSPSIHRSGSIVSKTASENLRGRSTPDFRNPGSRWSSKPRSSRAKFYQNSTFSSSRTTSRTSLEDSVWSPSASSTWSKSYFGRAQSAMSTDSLGSHMTQGDYGFQQSIGFANALSHAIIREEGAALEDVEGEAVELEDETLELAGAPWAKEGIVHHKHHLETTDKKSKDRNWNQCFAVVERGYVRLFSFNSKSSIRAKNKAPRGGVVGGGNWSENAEALDSFILRQTIANALPPPGYSKTRPHVFALSLPNGAVHLFQVGTPEIVKEFVSTANYWSARLSKEPLVGGVSNVEYGWSDSVVNQALLSPQLPPSADGSNRGSVATDITATGKSLSQSRTSMHSRTMSQLSSRPSLQGSIRSSGDPTGSGSLRSRMPADRIHLAEWTPPQQSLVASNLPEDEQLASLRKYVNDIEEELQRHNELRGPMCLAFSPRHPNATKAMANWERKSSYLLREIVKFRTYCDSLVAATVARERFDIERKEREEELAAIRSKKDKQKADEEEERDSLNLPEETMHALALAGNSNMEVV